MSKRRASYVLEMPQRARRITEKPQYMPRTPRGKPPVFRKGYDRRAGFYGRFAPLNPASAEMKFHDVDVDQSPVPSAGAIQNGGTVIVIPQGVTEKQRVGRKCTLKSINWRFTVKLTEVEGDASPPNSDIVRIIVYQDKQCNGATAAVTDILETADYQSFNNLSNKTRFRTLMDRTYNMNYQGLATNGTDSWGAPTLLIEDTFFKNCNIPVEYSSTTGAIAEIASNNIGMLFIARNAQCDIASKLRVRFHDY